MRKIAALLFFVLILSGCATYKFQKSPASGNQGYLVSYNGENILEYTVGKDKALPDLALAKERFKRRRSSVEYYCKKMGLIESRLKEAFWDPPAMFVDLLFGVFRWPFFAVSDYKYNHNPKYKERVDKLDEEKETLEKTRINNLKEKLSAYIVEDLAKEPVAEAAPAVQESVAVTPAQVIPPPVIPPKEEIKPPVAIKEIPEAKIASGPPVAVIIAKPIKGYSPLKVKFSGQKSSSKSSRIVAYDWNFGDGDTSTQKNPENTYWSTTYGARNFTVTLTVKDEAGNSSSATSTIEVSTR